MQVFEAGMGKERNVASDNHGAKLWSKEKRKSEDQAMGAKKREPKKRKRLKHRGPRDTNLEKDLTHRFHYLRHPLNLLLHRLLYNLNVPCKILAFFIIRLICVVHFFLLLVKHPR